MTRMLTISILIIISSSAMCQNKNSVMIDYEQPAELITNYDSLMNVNKHLLQQPNDCEKAGKRYVSFILNNSGSLDSLKVVRSPSLCEEADSIAMNLVTKLRFKPELYKGRPVKALKVIPVIFYKSE